MCIHKGTGIKTVKDMGKVVFKVFLRDSEGEYYLPFRAINGCNKKNVPFDLSVAQAMFKVPAVGWDKGMGYGCFSTLRQAFMYQYRFPSIIGRKKAVVCKCIIPIGSKYERGKIGSVFIGGGLHAMRAENLIFTGEVNELGNTVL